MAAIVIAVIFLLSRTRSLTRDLLPLALTLAAYREMNWVTPAAHAHRLENSWIVWDRLMLDNYRLRRAIESTGGLLPSYLELCYALVYAIAPVSIVLLLLDGRRDRINDF